MDRSSYNFLSKMLKLSKFTLFDYVILIIFILVLASFLAPIFAVLGWKEISHGIYFAYEFLCHQLDWRSVHFFDYQMAWCTRDTFIWLNVLIVSLMLKFNHIKPLKFRYIFIFALPMAIDGGIQLLSGANAILNESEFVYASSNFLRMLTGSFFGIGLGITVMPIIKGDEKFESNIYITFKKVFMLILISGVFYLALVQFWQFTGVSNLPSDFLDSATNKAKSTYEWTSRCDNCI